MQNYDIHDPETKNFIQIIDTDDYLIQSLSGHNYLIPGYEIPINGLLSIDYINKWKIQENWFGKKIFLEKTRR